MRPSHAPPPQDRAALQPRQAMNPLDEVESLARDGQIKEAVKVANQRRSFINYVLRQPGMKGQIQEKRPALAGILSRTGFFGPRGHCPSA